MKIMVLGATGLTGNLVLEQLLARPGVSSVVVPARRKLPSKHQQDILSLGGSG